MEAKDEALLRKSALRTWRLFREFSTAEENWLVPDTIMEPASQILHCISTTNLGLLLNSRLAAADLGFLTLPEFVADTERTFDSVDRMPRHDGQMYNWYDTRTLEAVKPRFISAVDNGNLVCSLWTIKQGCLGALEEPLFRREMWLAVQDHLDTIAELLREGQGALAEEVRNLSARAKSLGESAAAWSEALLCFEQDVVNLEKKLASDAKTSEAEWWAHELRLRVTHLQSLIYDFAPWLQPQFADCCLDPGLRQAIRAEKLTLKSLPELYAKIDQAVSRMLEGDSSIATESRLHLLRSAVGRASSISKALTTRLARLADRADDLAKGMDFKFFLDPKKKLLFTGYNVQEGRFTPSHYDLLASEARSAVFVAIAKGEIPQESWIALGRRFTSYGDERLLLSWTGTMFEYLMPLLWMKSYPNTLLDETTQAAVRVQRKYAESKSIPWGISEASCAKINAAGHYHYEAFGVPGLAVSRDLSPDLVVSPYSAFLSLHVDTKGAMENIHRMQELGWLGSYGFYEAADFTPSRVNSGSKFEIVRCWLAHHQGMSLMSVANMLCNGSSPRRFHAEPMVCATERLLHEKAPRTWQFEPSALVDDVKETAESKETAEISEENWGVAPKLNSVA